MLRTSGVLLSSGACVYVGLLCVARARYWASSIVHAGISLPAVGAQDVRTTFMDLPIAFHRTVAHHTHGEIAADRSTCSQFASRLANMLGMTAMYYQASSRDQQKMRCTSREYFWAKDITVRPSPMILPDNALLVLIDVDYYVDMPTFLADHRRPTLIYTFCPESVCGSFPNYVYTLTQNSEVDMRATGGSCYQHQVWNYGNDMILATKKFLGLTYSACLYHVDRRRTTDNRYLVMLTPVGHWNLVAPLVGWWFKCPLERYNYVHNGFTRMDVVSAGAHLRITGKPLSFLCASVTAKQDDAIAVLAQISTLPLNVPMVQSVIQGDSEDAHDVKLQAAMLTQYHRLKCASKPNFVFPVSMGVRSYTPMGVGYNMDEKPTMHAFMSPIVHECFAPTSCVANDAFSIVSRVINCRTDVEATPQLEAFMDEFIKLMFPMPYQLHPCDVDMVWEKQDRPTQRLILEAASVTIAGKQNIQSFMKAEAYRDPKPPRPISTINGVDKIDYSRFMYSLCDKLADLSWYAFKHTPVEIADLLVKILADARTFCNTDFNRMDGHVSGVLREFEKRLCLWVFHRSYHQQLIELLRSQHTLRGFTRHGVVYDTLFARNSGSPETSGFNTVGSALVAYIALRKTKVRGAFNSPKAAYAKMGLYGGDDGGTPDVDPEAYKDAATMVGQSLDINVVKRGELGVKFLARIYGPDVWHGDNNSMCDIARTMSKFHATTGSIPSNVDSLTKLKEKAIAYSLSDANTPILGDLCIKTIALLGSESTYDLRDNVPYLSKYPSNAQYPNTYADWMGDVVERVLPGFDSHRFITYLDSVTRPQQLLTFPVCIEPRAPKKTETTVVVDGNIINPKPMVSPPCQEGCGREAYTVDEQIWFVAQPAYKAGQLKMPKRCKACRSVAKLARANRGCWVESIFEDRPEPYRGLLHVVFEEWFKKALPIVGGSLCVLETAINAISRPDWYMALPTLIMHGVTFMLPLPAGILVHYAWNTLLPSRFDPGNWGRRAPAVEQLYPHPSNTNKTNKDHFMSSKSSSSWHPPNLPPQSKAKQVVIRMVNEKQKQKRSRRVNKSITHDGKLQSAPTSMARTIQTPLANVFRNTVDSTRLRHRELFFAPAALAGSLFQVGQSFPINPGMVTMFPWLSLQAIGWEKYEFKSLRLTYQPRLSTSTTGVMMLATDYDSADNPPADEITMASYHGAVTGNVWQNFNMDLDPKQLTGPRYIRNAPLAANLDIKTYDVGNFFWGTDCTLNAGSGLGRFYVEYDVVLSVPQLATSGLQQRISGEVFSGASTPSVGVPFGAGPTAIGQLTHNSVAQTLAGTVATFRGLNIGDKYRMCSILRGTSLSDGSLDVSLGAGGSGETGVKGINNTATYLIQDIIFVATAAAAVLDFTLDTDGGATFSQLSAWITDYTGFV